VEQETHKTSKAISRLDNLYQQYPKNVGVVTGLAITNRAYGRRLVAMDLAKRAHELEPENRWVNILLADIEKDDKNWVKVNADLLHGSGNNQFLSKLSGMQTVNRNVKIGGAVENNMYSYENLRDARGVIGDGSGTAQRGQVDVQYEAENGVMLKTTAYMNPDASLGVGQQVTVQDDLGTATIYAEYQRSDWTATERIDDNVKRDRIGVTHTYSPEANVYSYFGAAVTRYDQDNKERAAQSYSLSGGINAPVAILYPPLEGMPVTVGYGLDGEYFTSRALGVSPIGQTYYLYPLESGR
jgi:hypothetical protein